MPTIFTPQGDIVIGEPSVVKRGRILKAIAFGAKPTTYVKEEFPSKQLGDDIFATSEAYTDALRVPPYGLEQLALLAESHPVHAAAIEQKTTDVIASGVQWKPKSDKGDIEQQEKVTQWWESLFHDASNVEILQAVWSDYETLGWGFLEISKDVQDVVKQLYHIPAHTVRAHRDGIRFAQVRGARTAYFKRWNSTADEFWLHGGRSIGNRATKPPPEQLASEVLVFRKPARRSAFYGIPIYIAAIGHITLSIAARDYNILFFENSREPRHLIVISGLGAGGDSDAAAEAAEDVFSETKDDPHRSIILPLEGDTKVEVVKMGLPQNDMHFSKLIEQMDAEILIAHRMPGDRVGAVKRGFLGGSVAHVGNVIYKDGVVSKAQSIASHRIQNFAEVEYPKANEGKELQYRATLTELDITDEGADADVTIALVKVNLITLNEGRQRMGQSKHEPFGDMTFAEFLVDQGVPVTAKSFLDGVDNPDAIGLNERLEIQMRSIEETIEELTSADKPVLEGAK